MGYPWFAKTNLPRRRRQTNAEGCLLILKACLGLEIRGDEGEVVFWNPILPYYIQEVKLTGLSVGAGSIDLLLRRYGKDVTVNVLGREGQVVLEIVK